MPTVNVAPMPESTRKIPKRLRPQHPPIFEGTDPATPEDIELARALFLELDEESQLWYGYAGIFAGLERKRPKGKKS